MDTVETTRSPKIISKAELERENSTGSHTLVRSKGMELNRIAQLAGSKSGTRTATDDVLLQCLHGRFECEVQGTSHVLGAGDLAWIPAGTKHSWVCAEDGALLSMNVKYGLAGQDADEVDEASEESFPASDPPAWSPTTS